MNNASRIQQLQEFKRRLRNVDGLDEPERREWLNQNAQSVRREVDEAGCYVVGTITPPPMIGGLVIENADPFHMMFNAPYGMSMTDTICDMIDKTIGILIAPPRHHNK